MEVPAAATGYRSVDRRALLLGPLPAVVLAGCGVSLAAQQESATNDDPPTTEPGPTSTEASPGNELQVDPERVIPPTEPVTISLSLYLMQDAADAVGSPLSSQRTEEGLSVIARDMGEVWSQANVIFDPITVETVLAPTDVLEGIARGLDTTAFFDQVGTTFDIANPSAVNGFYIRSAGRVNGFAPSNSRVFFVIDEPSVHDERVSSHEVGHIFGLHHQLEDPGTLMFSGTNGTLLTEDEITVARYSAQGVLDGVR